MTTVSDLWDSPIRIRRGSSSRGSTRSPPSGATVNFEMRNGFLARAGYGKEMEYVVYRVDLPKRVPEFFRKVAERAGAAGGCHLVDRRRRAEIKPLIGRVLALMNQCFQELYGYHRWTERK